MPANKATARKRATAKGGGGNRPTGGKPGAKASAGKAARQIRKPGMSTNLKVTLGALAVALVAVLAVVLVNRATTPQPSAAVDAAVRADSHRLSTADDGKVTLVEFLDFECESCLAAYPDVEKLRAEYADRITYVVRYFPIASHPNAFNAAHAAEAAARQGKFEQMYVKLFDNAKAWGHSEQSQTAAFEGYAQELGLDMAKFRADVASPEVEARVQVDFADGQALGVQGTPTFFINGQKFTGDPTYAGLKAAVDELLTQ